jgi:hypothetical protein
METRQASDADRSDDEILALSELTMTATLSVTDKASVDVNDTAATSLAPVETLSVAVNVNAVAEDSCIFTEHESEAKSATLMEAASVMRMGIARASNTTAFDTDSVKATLLESVTNGASVIANATMTASSAVCVHPHATLVVETVL